MFNGQKGIRDEHKLLKTMFQEVIKSAMITHKKGNITEKCGHIDKNVKGLHTYKNFRKQ